MTRPHIEFIQSQALPWKKGLAGGSDSPEVEMKVLSYDDDTGGATILVRMPGGYRLSDPHYFLCDSELYVLDGSLEINGNLYGKHCYGHLPRGYVRHETVSPDGAVILLFFSAAPRAKAGGAPGEPYDQERLAECVDVFGDDWDDIGSIGNPGLKESGARLKMLRQDPETGEQSYVLAMLPWAETRTESHPVVQEMYLLSGEIAGTNIGLMQPGAYFWRPENIVHGPFASRTGNLVFMRAMGGALTTRFFAEQPIDYDPPHNPVLPAPLKKYGRKPWPVFAAF